MQDLSQFSKVVLEQKSDEEIPENPNPYWCYACDCLKILCGHS